MDSYNNVVIEDAKLVFSLSGNGPHNKQPAFKPGLAARFINETRDDAGRLAFAGEFGPLVQNGVFYMRESTGEWYTSGTVPEYSESLLSWEHCRALMESCTRAYAAITASETEGEFIELMEAAGWTVKTRRWDVQVDMSPSAMAQNVPQLPSGMLEDEYSIHLGPRFIPNLSEPYKKGNSDKLENMKSAAMTLLAHAINACTPAVRYVFHDGSIRRYSESTCMADILWTDLAEGMTRDKVFRCPYCGTVQYLAGGVTPRHTTCGKPACRTRKNRAKQKK